MDRNFVRELNYFSLSVIPAYAGIHPMYSFLRKIWIPTFAGMTELIMTYTTQGIVLKKIPAGEADAIAVLYTRDFGKIRAFVQGVKKESAKLKGHIEPFSLSYVQFVIGNTGERLTYAQMLQSWPVIRDDFDRLAKAFYMTELIDRHCLVSEPDNDIWELLLVSLAALNQEGRSACEVIKSFEHDLLECLGYAGEKDMSVLGPGIALY